MQDSRTAHVQLRFVSDDWQEVKAMSNKVYVDVLAEFTTDGILIPRSLRWKDGTVYEIQRVNDMRRATSLKAGGVGMRYTCMIDGRESHLYYEDNNLWFVEGRA